VTPLNREPILAGMAGMASLAGMVGHSPLLRDVARQIERVAPYFRTALITGETGTGKELAAQALHAARPGNPGQLIALNCSAVVETLFESELFGHVRGAFTDACRDKAGLFEMAHQGTLFLDEIGDLPLPTQAKLLRVVQQQEVLRVGSVTPRKVDVRIIAATNRDLRQEVQAKRFREDLYYRLSMLELEMPPLRQRMDDVPELARHFAAGWAAQNGRPVSAIAGEVLGRLEGHTWPGNVRELENVMGYACMLADGGTIWLADLPKYLREPSLSPALPEYLPVPQVLSGGVANVLEEYERRLLLEALHRSEQNQSRAARALRTSRDRLRYKMKKYGLDLPAGPALCA